jgi:D-lactate dehydrogenase
MTRPTPSPGFTTRLRDLLGRDAVLDDPAECRTYGYDNSRRLVSPALVAFARDPEQVGACVALCHEHRVPVVARGRGTGTAGAAVPVRGGLVLSLERMTEILRVDPDNRLLTAQPGVTNQAVQQAAAEVGFFWPPDPTSSEYCSIGGNLACNAAGPRAVKYGTPRDNILGLRAVTGRGEPIHTGVQTTKGVVGYDLTRLIVGSEGTLAIIVEATLKLTPLPETKRTLRAVYRDMTAAARAVSRIMAQPVTPCALEFMDARAIDLVRRRGAADLPEQAGALLMIEVDGPVAGIEAAVEQVSQAAAAPGLLDLRAARSEAEVSALWATRKALSPALRSIAPKKINEDVVVPVSRMGELIDGLRELAQAHRITIVNFGHAGNGNIHVNLLVDPHDREQMRRAETCLDAVFDLVLRLDGTLSGEHGIGLVKKEFVGRELDSVSLRLMRGIKAQFDPRDILNPGKLFPSQETGQEFGVGPK